MDTSILKNKIRRKIQDLAASLGNEGGGIADDDLIIASGVLDSAAIMELVVWYEGEIGMPLAPDEITIDNLGTIDQMANFAARKRAGREPDRGSA